MKQAAPLYVSVVVAIVCLSALPLLSPGPGYPFAAWTQPSPPLILWQSPSSTPVPCPQGTAQAVVYGAHGADFKAPEGPYAEGGCSQTWLVLLPPHEGGDLKAEVSYYAQNRGLFSGVIMDDFAPESFAAYTELESMTTVCPVVYSSAEQPPITKGGCVILVVQPAMATGPAFASVRGWQLAIERDASRIDSSELWLLAYAAWPYPLPGPYFPGVEAAAQSLGAGVILWHPTGAPP